MLVGAGTVRASVAGYQVQRLEPAIMPPSTPAAGAGPGRRALGVSLGLGYAPECFYTTDELIRALGPLAGRASPSPSTCARRAGGVVTAAQEMVEVPGPSGPGPDGVGKSSSLALIAGARKSSWQRRGTRRAIWPTRATAAASAHISPTCPKAWARVTGMFWSS